MRRAFFRFPMTSLPRLPGLSTSRARLAQRRSESCGTSAELQHGIFAKRYNIAFAGYAAAVIELIDVTVEQMQKGPNGGVTCEPGLMFFACNSHPHVALSVFSKLSYVDWSADAARWEKWALSHYPSPSPTARGSRI